MMTVAWDRPARLVFAFIFALLMFFRCGIPTPFMANGSAAPQYLVADDSVISFRVAANIAAGQGPYFNAGERTAANTSLFWPYCISPFFRYIQDRGQSVLAVAIFSCLLCAFTAGLTVFWARSWAAGLSVGLTLCALPFFSEYGNSAWEHIPQILLVTLAYAVLTGRLGTPVVQRYPMAMVVLALAFWMRPDTLPLFVPIALIMLRNKSARSLPFTYASISFAGAMVAFYFGMHHHLYGFYVPNTYYLKVNLGSSSVLAGVMYVLRSSVNSGIVPFALLLPVLCWFQRDNFSREEVTIVAAMVLQTAYICLVGGDAFRYGRFFALLGPIAILLFWEKFWQNKAASPMYLLLGAVCLTGLFVANAHQSLISTEQKVLLVSPGVATPVPTLVVQQASMAGYLRQRITPGDGQIGLFTLGALAYYMPEYKVADFLGKADPVIAHEPVRWGTIGHNKWDIEHTLRDRHVSVVPFVPMTDDAARQILRTRQDFAFAAALQLDPYMSLNYTYRSWRQLGLPGDEGLLIRNDLLNRFPAYAIAMEDAMH